MMAVHSILTNIWEEWSQLKGPIVNLYYKGSTQEAQKRLLIQQKQICFDWAKKVYCILRIMAINMHVNAFYFKF